MTAYYTGQPTSRRRTVVIIGILAALVLLGGIAYAVLGGDTTEQSTHEQSPAAPISKTYIDEDSKLSFDYPAKWSVKSEVDEANGVKYTTVYDENENAIAQLALDPEAPVSTDELADIEIVESKQVIASSKTPSYAVFGIYQAEDGYSPVFGISPYSASVAKGQIMKATLIEPSDAGKYKSIRFEQLFDEAFSDKAEAEAYFKSDEAQALYKLFQSFKLG